MTTHRRELSIARDFATMPGPRKRLDGQHSGEEFLTRHLRPAFLEAQEHDGVVEVDLDGVAGYPTSFLEEAFGGLAREFGPDIVMPRLTFICTEEPYLEDEIRRYIREANRP